MDVAYIPDDELYPFESRWFTTSAGRMHYIDEGTGPTILFSHGTPEWSFAYRHLVLVLRDRFRCVAADLHGFGLSQRPNAGFDYTAEEHVDTLGQLVEHLELDDFIVMGHDWGGPIGLAVAAERADRVRGVIVGNTWFWAATPYFRAFSLVASSPPAQWLIRERNILVEVFLARARTLPLSGAEMAHHRGVQPTASARVGVGAVPRQIRASPLFATLEDTVAERLGAKPALIVWGMRDWGFRSNYMSRVRAAFSDHVFVPLPAANHYVQEDAPTAIAQAIAQRFLPCA